MTFGLLAGGPLQMLFSLLLMQGLSLTMFRTFLNQAIPRFDPLRFSVNLGNRDDSRTSTTTQAPILDPRLVSSYLSILSPLLTQQQIQQMQTQNMAQMLTTHQHPAQALQPVSNPMPNVIVVPQIVPQNVRTGSASTLIPSVVKPDVRVEEPEEEVEDDIPIRIYKRMLERPPKTTRKPKVAKFNHAGALHVTFVTPKVPAGYRRYVITAVTADPIVLNPDLSLNVNETGNKDNIKFVDNIESENNSTTKLGLAFDSHLNFPFDTTNASEVTTSAVTDEAVAEPKNSNHNYNNSNDTHEEYVNYVKNITNTSHIESNQSPEEDLDEKESQIYFENSKDSNSSYNYKRVCYYQISFPVGGDVKISEIDPFICTHLIVGYARVSFNNLMVPKNPSEDPEKYRELTNLKAKNRKLKVMISVGDVSGGAFSKMVLNESTRDTFVASALDICDMFNFDGIDIDWEFPAFKGGSKADKSNFISLLKDLRSESLRRFREDFIISAAVGTPLVIAMNSYDIPLIADVVDFVNLMSYDYHYYRADKPYTGHHSPLYPRPIEKGYFLTLNAAWSATYWANKGMPLRKIILGIPLYARTYNLVVPLSGGLDVPVSGPGIGNGKLNYTGVCNFLSTGATKEFDLHSQVPFAHKGYDWISFENELSVSLKTEWVVRAGMGGVMTFSLNYDDSKGICRKDGKKFPLQKAISNLLELSSIKAYQQTDHLRELFNNYIN